MRDDSKTAGRRGSGAVRGPASVGAHRGAPSWSQIAALVRRIAGMPDYARHVEHLRRDHPGHPIPTERQFYEEFLLTRYADGPTRCC